MNKNGSISLVLWLRVVFAIFIVIILTTLFLTSSKAITVTNETLHEREFDSLVNERSSILNKTTPEGSLERGYG